jgi:hypothetical protein
MLLGYQKGKIQAFQIQPMIFSRYSTNSSWIHAAERRGSPKGSCRAQAPLRDREASLHTDITETSQAPGMQVHDSGTLQDPRNKLNVLIYDPNYCTVTEKLTHPHESPCGTGSVTRNQIAACFLYTDLLTRKVHEAIGPPIDPDIWNIMSFSMASESESPCIYFAGTDSRRCGSKCIYDITSMQPPFTSARVPQSFPT